MSQLPPEFAGFVASVANSYHSKAEQCWEFSEDLQNDVVMPIKTMIAAQTDELSDLQ